MQKGPLVLGGSVGERHHKEKNENSSQQQIHEDLPGQKNLLLIII
jgi:hypothetical protein